MFGLKGAGLAGATVALAGGVAYLVWVYATSSRERRAGKGPGRGGEGPRREGERKEEEEPLVAAAAAPVAAAAAPESSEVSRNRTGPDGASGTVDELPKEAFNMLVFLSFILLCGDLRRFFIRFVRAYALVQSPELICDPGPGSWSGWSRKNQPAALLVHRQPGAGRPSKRGLQRRLHQQRPGPRGVPGK